MYEPFKEKTEMEVKNAEEPEVEIVNGAMHTSPVVIETVKIDPSPLNKEPPSSGIFFCGFYANNNLLICQRLIKLTLSYI